MLEWKCSSFWLASPHPLRPALAPCSGGETGAYPLRSVTPSSYPQDYPHTLSQDALSGRASTGQRREKETNGSVRHCRRTLSVAAWAPSTTQETSPQIWPPHPRPAAARGISRDAQAPRRRLQRGCEEESIADDSTARQCLSRRKIPLRAPLRRRRQEHLRRALSNDYRGRHRRTLRLSGTRDREVDVTPPERACLLIPAGSVSGGAPEGE